jgi:ribosomal-protein-alanine N-acetyltransferase
MRENTDLRTQTCPVARAGPATFVESLRTMAVDNRERARGTRVLLRAPGTRDQDEFLTLAHASRTHLHPWVHVAQSAAQFRDYLARADHPSTRLSLICRTVDGTIVGGCNLNEIVRGNFQSAYLGYWCFGPHAGRGYMTEAIDLTLEYAFDRLGLHRVEANIQPGNHRSLALAARCGFTLEGFSPAYLQIGGVWRDHERWAILADTWRSRRGGADRV